jgi:hypothetical protein
MVDDAKSKNIFQIFSNIGKIASRKGMYHSILLSAVSREKLRPELASSKRAA